MPSIDFTLPHWAYWLGLIIFPLVAMSLARRPKIVDKGYSTVLAYFILITGGMIGLHRFYLKSMIGLIYIPVFLFVLYSNSQGAAARSEYSNAANAVRMAESTIERETDRIEKSKASLPELQAAFDTAEEGSFSKKGAKKKLDRAQSRIEKSTTAVSEAKETLVSAAPIADGAKASVDFWGNAARYAFYAILAFMLIDALLIPSLAAKATANIPPTQEKSEAELALEKLEAEERKEDHEWVADGFAGRLDRISLMAGEFVSYWAVIAVIVYYFEVISRYVFNSPTNWAHESMYLMFGMQYLIAGSYAMLTESHVRVDIFYANWSARRKAFVNLLTSVFFFIFAGTLLVTSYIFAFDAIAVPSGNSIISDWARGDVSLNEMFAGLSLSQWTDPNIRWGEISFNEWEIPLWPMKWMMVVGGLLLVLQGISKISLDVRTLVKGA